MSKIEWTVRSLRNEWILREAYRFINTWYWQSAYLWPVRKMHLFLSIVGRMHYESRMPIKLSWEVAGIVHHRKDPQ